MTLCLPCFRMALRSLYTISPTLQSRLSRCTHPLHVSPHSLPLSRPTSSQSPMTGSSFSLLKFSFTFRRLNKRRRGNRTKKQPYLCRRLIVVGTSRLPQHLSSLGTHRALRNRHSAQYLHHFSNMSLGSIGQHIRISQRPQFLYLQGHRVNTSFQIACRIPKNMFLPTGD